MKLELFQVDMDMEKLRNFSKSLDKNKIAVALEEEQIKNKMIDSLYLSLNIIYYQCRKRKIDK
jgi:hypothetical protein